VPITFLTSNRVPVETLVDSLQTSAFAPEVAPVIISPLPYH
jgi:hypothetical protein